MNMNEQQIEMKAEDILSRYNNVEWSGEGDSLYTANQMFHAIVTALKEGAAPVGEAPLLDYPQAARVIALYLKPYCNEDLAYPDMIAQAAREVAAEVERLRGEREALLKIAKEQSSDYERILSALEEIADHVTGEADDAVLMQRIANKALNPKPHNP
jgi:hypothetical protein